MKIGMKMQMNDNMMKKMGMQIYSPLAILNDKERFYT